MRFGLTTMMLLAAVATAAAQDAEKPKSAWQQPGEIQKPTGPWLKPGEIQKPTGPWTKPAEVQAPTGPWTKPAEIQTPTGQWVKPGEIQVPKGIQAVRVTEATCERRLSVVADALFDFDKSQLRPDAEETLATVGPEIAKTAKGPATIEGHTDAKGSDAYNQKLSEARAKAARDWLAAHGFVPMSTPIKGFGKTRPAAPNQTADGRDDPEGRQKNRRVEIVFSTCG
jgi:outer membrane protein OmpA-like peptidoglycan-associated protein